MTQSLSTPFSSLLTTIWAINSGLQHTLQDTVHLRFILHTAHPIQFTAHPRAHPTAHPVAHPIHFTAHPTAHPIQFTADLTAHPSSLQHTLQRTHSVYSTPYITPHPVYSTPHPLYSTPHPLSSTPYSTPHLVYSTPYITPHPVYSTPYSRPHPVYSTPYSTRPVYSTPYSTRPVYSTPYSTHPSSLQLGESPVSCPESMAVTWGSTEAKVSKSPIGSPYAPHRRPIGTP